MVLYLGDHKLSDVSLTTLATTGNYIAWKDTAKEKNDANIDKATGYHLSDNFNKVQVDGLNSHAAGTITDDHFRDFIRDKLDNTGDDAYARFSVEAMNSDKIKEGNNDQLADNSDKEVKELSLTNEKGQFDAADMMYGDRGMDDFFSLMPVVKGGNSVDGNIDDDIDDLKHFVYTVQISDIGDAGLELEDNPDNLMTEVGVTDDCENGDDFESFDAVESSGLEDKQSEMGVNEYNGQILGREGIEGKEQTTKRQCRKHSQKHKRRNQHGRHSKPRHKTKHKILKHLLRRVFGRKVERTHRKNNEWLRGLKHTYHKKQRRHSMPRCNFAKCTNRYKRRHRVLNHLLTKVIKRLSGRNVERRHRKDNEWLRDLKHTYHRKQRHHTKQRHHRRHKRHRRHRRHSRHRRHRRHSRRYRRHRRHRRHKHHRRHSRRYRQHQLRHLIRRLPMRKVVREIPLKRLVRRTPAREVIRKIRRKGKKMWRRLGDRLYFKRYHSLLKKYHLLQKKYHTFKSRHRKVKKACSNTTYKIVSHYCKKIQKKMNDYHKVYSKVRGCRSKNCRFYEKTTNTTRNYYKFMYKVHPTLAICNQFLQG